MTIDRPRRLSLSPSPESVALNVRALVMLDLIEKRRTCSSIAWPRQSLANELLHGLERRAEPVPKDFRNAFFSAIIEIGMELR